MSGAQLSKERLDRMHEVLAGYVTRGEVPGLVSLVSRRGEVHVDTIGTLAAGGTSPVRRDSIFRIASMTKPVTAVATMILVEECKVRLDEPVDRLLPELADRRVLRRIDAPLQDADAAVRPITVRDLLTFRMGFGQLPTAPEAYPILRAAVDLELGMGPPDPGGMPPPDEWIRRLGTLPLMHQPGSHWIYNTGSDVLGVLLARAAGQPFEQLLRERIFEPLGMKDTAFSVEASALGRFATAYWTSPVTGALDLADEPAGAWSRPPAFPSGGGGLVSTVDDYLAFGQMLLDGGRYGTERILARSSVDAMTTDQLTAAQRSSAGFAADFFDAHGWGFGVAVRTRLGVGHGSVGSFGWDGGLGTSAWVDPAEEMVGILLTQASWTSPMPPAVCDDFWTCAYAAVDD